MKFPQFYVIASIVLIVASPILLPSNAAPVLGLLLGPVWMILSLVALRKFQMLKLPLLVPMLCFVLMGIEWQILSLAVTARPFEHEIMTVSYIVFLCGLLVFLVAAVRLLFQLRKAPIAGADHCADSSVIPGAGFWRRLAAMLIDSVALGLAGALIFSAVVGAFAAFAIVVQHREVSGVFEYLFASPSPGPFLPNGVLPLCALVGFIFGFLSPVGAFMHVLCSLGVLSLVTITPVEAHASYWVGCGTIVVINVLCLLYFALMECSRHQGSLGKVIMHLKVTGEDDRQVTFRQALLRNVFKCISIGSLGLGFIYVGISPTKQGFHDLLAKCLVVKQQAQAAPDSSSPMVSPA